MDELELQTREVLEGKPPTTKIFPFQVSVLAVILCISESWGPNSCQTSRGGSVKTRQHVHVHLSVIQRYSNVKSVPSVCVSTFVGTCACLSGACILIYHTPHTLSVCVACVVLQYAFNLFSHNSPMGPNGYNEEEMKMVRETHKIWGEDDVAITATCIRVPIMRAHAESINLEFARDISEEEVRGRSGPCALFCGMLLCACQCLQYMCAGGGPGIKTGTGMEGSIHIVWGSSCPSVDLVFWSLPCMMIVYVDDLLVHACLVLTTQVSPGVLRCTLPLNHYL